MRRALFLVALGCATGRATAAHAAPDDLVARPIVLRAGQLAADLTVEVNLAHNYLAEPLSLAPDVWLGVTSRWTVGLVHSSSTLDRFVPGASLCVRQDPLYCDALYRGGGVDARYLALDASGLAIAPRARALLRDLAPVKPAVTVGALVRWTRGRYAIIADPYLQLGLANQEQGNRTQLWVPVELALQPTCRWKLSLHTGWNSELSVLRDGWRIPLALGARARATERWDVGATLGFASLIGPQNTPKQRVLFVTLSWRGA